MSTRSTVPEWKQAFLDFEKRVSLDGKPAPATREKILIWSITSGAIHLLNRDLYWGLLARNHGYDVTMVLCDGSLGACILNSAFDNKPPEQWHRTCRNCRMIGEKSLKAAQIPFVLLGDVLTSTDHKEAESFALNFDATTYLHKEFHQIQAGKYAVAALGRYGRSPYPVALERYGELLPRFVKAGCLSTIATERLLEAHDPALVITGHRTYVEWGPAWDVMAYREQAIMMCQPGIVEGHVVMKVFHDDYTNGSYTLPHAEWEECKRQGVGVVKARELESFVSRYKAGMGLREKFFDAKMPERDELRKELGITGDKPVWCIYTHLVWDAQMSDDMVYPDISTWLLETCRIITEATDVHWIIKVHPSEYHNSTEFGAQQELDAFFADGLPDHITVYPSESRVNSYHLHELVDGGVTVRGTVGMELTMMGKPVILCSEGHYYGKGFTVDCTTEAQYRHALQNAASIPKLTKEEQALAKNYAHNFFVDRQIWLDFDALMQNCTSHDDFKKGGRVESDRLLECIMEYVDGGTTRCVLKGMTKPA